MNGPVCDDNWDIDDGHVVCRELGFHSAIEITKGSYFGHVYTDFTTNNVQCTGEESALEFCQRQDKSKTFCSRREAAGVLCNTTKTEATNSHHVTKRQGADTVTLGTEVLNHLGLTDCNKHC